MLHLSSCPRSVPFSAVSRIWAPPVSTSWDDEHRLVKCELDVAPWRAERAHRTTRSLPSSTRRLCCRPTRVLSGATMCPALLQALCQRIDARRFYVLAQILNGHTARSGPVVILLLRRAPRWSLRASPSVDQIQASGRSCSGRTPFVSREPSAARRDVTAPTGTRPTGLSCRVRSDLHPPRSSCDG